MRYLIILIIFLISFNAYADQNDNRLDQLFKALLHSQNGYEINIITAEIWKIWGETDDLIILDDFKKGVKLMQSRQLIKALTLFSKVIERNPNFAEAWNKRATVYYLIGDYNSSILDIEKTLKLEPRHFGALDGLGLIFIDLREYENAMKVYNQLLKIFPYNNSIIKKRETILSLISKEI